MLRQKAARQTIVVDLFSEAYDVYMGCPSDKTDPREIEPGHPGFLGNPFYDGSFQENLLWFKHYFLERLERDRRFRKSVLSLHGCRLGCVCDIGTYCHAHIVADWINENYGEHQHLFQYQLQEINKNLRQAN